MQPQTLNREVVTRGVKATASFGISLTNQAFLMRILRDTMYTDKVLAVLREYSANAWDAHRAAGIPDIPIKVVLPTELEPNLVIRDFGLGLSPKWVFERYTQYGDSSKRESNDEVGLFGIGCKSGFAYGDSFTVTSYHDGVKRIFVASLDKDDMGDMSLLHESPCGDETGIEIKIAVRPHDVETFHDRAARLFPFFYPFPEINSTTIQPVQAARHQHGYFDKSSGWVGIMGCIPYRLNIEQVRPMLEQRNLWEFAKNQSGGLFFDIGKVKVNASREELEYVDQTKDAIVLAFRLLRKELVQQLKKDCTNEAISLFQKRLVVQEALSLGISPPKGYGVLAPQQVAVYGRLPENKRDPNGISIPAPQNWRLQYLHDNRAHEQPWLWVSNKSRIVIRDTPRTLRGYTDLDNKFTMLVTPKTVAAFHEEKPPSQATLKSLGRFLERAALTGIPILRASEMAWEKPSATSYGGGWSNPKHRVSCFTYKGTKEATRSNSWDIVTREPQEDDVFLVINRFEGVGFSDFYRTYAKDSDLVGRLGETMPVVYGYKTTQKKPVQAKDCIGISYAEWRKQLAKRIVAENPTLKKFFRAMFWAQVMPTINCWRREFNWKDTTALFKEHLPKNHPINVLLRRRAWGIKVWGTRTQHFSFTNEQFEFLYREAGGKIRAPRKALDAIYTRYPLLKKGYGADGWKVFGGPKDGDEQRAHWFHYIHLVDSMENLNV